MDQRQKQILEKLETQRRELSLLSEEIWGIIDHNDPEGLQAGISLKQSFNSVNHYLGESIDKFKDVFDITRFIDDPTSFATYREKNDDIQRYTEDFFSLRDADLSFKKPNFVQIYAHKKKVNNWADLMAFVCEIIHEKVGRNKFREVLSAEEFIKPRGRKHFSERRHDFEQFRRCKEGVFIDTRLKVIENRKLIIDLLEYFDIPLSNFHVNLQRKHE